MAQYSKSRDAWWSGLAGLAIVALLVFGAGVAVGVWVG